MVRYTSWLVAAAATHVYMDVANGQVPAQGSKVVSRNAAGQEEYKTAKGPIRVIDYNLPEWSSIPLRPTLVYNCAYMESICKNVVKYLGYLPTRANPTIMHFDPDSNRKKARRGAACPDKKPGWANILKDDGTPRCPEPDQPKWIAYVMDAKQGPFDAEIHPVPETQSYNRLSSSWEKIDVDEKGKITETTVWDDYDTIMSCDEFPAATWIEGGAAGDGVKAATEYCSPLHNTCKKTAPPKTKQKRAKAKEPKPSKTWMTDQNWQGQSHQRLRTFLENVFKKLSASRASFGSAVYRFNLVTVNDAKEKHASWVEANGSKRFCVGPGALGAENNRGCTSDLVKGADYP